MNGTELISLIQSALPVATSAISAIGGAIFTSVFLRKNTSTKEFEKLKAGKMQEVADDLLESGKMTYTEYYKAGNFLSIAQKADEEYSKMPHNDPTADYDFDWYMRFYEAVGNVSDEEMQRVWAKILAGEVNRPGSFSLETLDVLRNLCKHDAELFTKICKHCIQSSLQELFLPRYNYYLEKCGITYSEILRLDEIGLVNSSGFIVYDLNINNDNLAAFINQSLIMFIVAKNDNIKKCSINQYPFTRIGFEIATLIGETTSDDDFIMFAKEVAKDQSFKVSVHKINSYVGGSINYNKIDLLIE